MIVAEDSIPGQLDDIKQRVGYLESGMAENTAITRQLVVKMDEHYTMLGELKEEKVAKAWLKKSYVGLGALAAATTAIGGSALAAWHWLGGKP